MVEIKEVKSIHEEESKYKLPVRERVVKSWKLFIPNERVFMTFNSMYYSFMIIQPSNTKYLHLLKTLSSNASLGNDNSILIKNLKEYLK